MIDFTSGWLVANVGHDNRAIMRAVSRAKGWAVIAGMDNPMRKCAEDILRSILPSYLNCFAFYNSGSEAIDAVIRFTDYPIVTHESAYHGSTIGAEMKRKHYGELNNLPWATVFIETFLGAWCEWHPPEFIKSLRRRQNNGELIVVFDEMQAGFGRTGKWFGFEHYDIEPDFVVGGKAAAGGFPFAFVVGRKKLMEGKDTHESTFSGNALCCAAFAETVKQIRKHRLIEKVCDNEYLINVALPHAQGHGYAYAFECAKAESVVKAAAKRGLLLLNTGRKTIKIAPPLCISRQDLWKGLQIIMEVL